MLIKHDFISFSAVTCPFAYSLKLYLGTRLTYAASVTKERGFSANASFIFSYKSRDARIAGNRRLLCMSLEPNNYTSAVNMSAYLFW